MVMRNAVFYTNDCSMGTARMTSHCKCLFVFAATGCPVFLFLDGLAVDASDPTRMLSLMSQGSSPDCLKLRVLRCPALLGQGGGWRVESCAHWSRSSSLGLGPLMSYFSTWAPGRFLPPSEALKQHTVTRKGSLL